jgi:hypothetical protein
VILVASDRQRERERGTWQSSDPGRRRRRALFVTCTANPFQGEPGCRTHTEILNTVRLKEKKKATTGSSRFSLPLARGRKHHRAVKTPAREGKEVKTWTASHSLLSAIRWTVSNSLWIRDSPSCRPRPASECTRY